MNFFQQTVVDVKLHLLCKAAQLLKMLSIYFVGIFQLGNALNNGNERSD